MMMMLTLYVDGYFVNPFDATCFVALEEKQVPYTTARALLRDGQGVPAGLHHRTGLARVPALQHGDFWLTESIAIVEYLDQIFEVPRLLPGEPRARARALQIMAWLRFDLRALREQRPFWTTFYPAKHAPLNELATREARDLVELTAWLDDHGELAAWNISHADLAFALWRLARTGYALPSPADRFLDSVIARPSVRAYLDHPRPPHPPP
jgi:glutathione S-transferase